MINAQQSTVIKERDTTRPLKYAKQRIKTDTTLLGIKPNQIQRIPTGFITNKTRYGETNRQTICFKLIIIIIKKKFTIIQAKLDQERVATGSY